MKKVIWLVTLFLIAGMALAEDRSIINREDLSLKAGPTEPGEEVSLVWLECYVYPKSVREERVISLGVRTTARVEGVSATFDFGRDQVALTSNDGTYWSGAYRVPDSVPAGLHVARYQISGGRGSIKRTVEFFVEEKLDISGREQRVAQGEAIYVQSWPLTVTATCAALVGGSSRILYAGEKVIGVSKMPWYKVIFADGQEGWVSAARVKEPLEEYYQLGYEAFRNKKFQAAIEYYQNTIAIKPEFVRGHFWLAKSYQAKGDLESAYSSIMEALRLDDRNIESRAFAASLAGSLFEQAQAKARQQRYHEAVAAYQKVVDLKPSSILSWVELGKAYQALNLPLEARGAWRDGLRAEPESRELRALLNLESAPIAVARTEAPVKTPAPKASPKAVAKAAPEVPALLADDSLEAVRGVRTKKGTRVDAALKSVLALTKSLGTPIAEKGWQTEKRGDQFLVRYICEQSGGVQEIFEWLVNVDSRRVSASNANSQLLMDRW